MRSTRLQIVLACSSFIAGSTAVYAQDSAEERLSTAKALECTFTVMTTGTWRDGVPQTESKAASLAIAFQAIDTDEGFARAVGAFGPSHTTVKPSPDSSSAAPSGKAACTLRPCFPRRLKTEAASADPI